MQNQQPDQGRRIQIRWTLSNQLSLLRAFMAAPAVWAILNNHTVLALTLCTLGVVTDLADGYVARKMNQVTEFGKVIDPLADKIYIAAVVVALLTQGKLPVWLVAVVLGRDVLILVAGLYIKRRTGQVLPSNYPGKLAVLTLSFMLFSVIAGFPEWLSICFMSTALALLALSIVMYTRRAVGTLKSTAGP